MSISLILGVSYLLLLSIISVVIYSACVVAGRATQAAEMQTAKINRLQNVRRARIQYHARATWQRQPLRS